jgi:alkylation response protein AidB-like acyl-CoA dehydrogenase
MFEPGGDPEVLRAGVRDWCAEHVPPNWRDEMLDADHDQISTFLRWWAGELREAGLIAPHWPKEWGGGFSIPEQVVIAEEFAKGGVPRNGIFHVAVFNVAPTLLHSATPEQKERFIGGIKKGEAWCQGFSEPNAGSDLASLRTRAVLDGDNYVINGQKVWTSWAAYADWCMLLVRTDPDAPKHKGITCIVADMKTPGLEARTIRQASGAADFCELFLDDVVVPAENVIGDVNNGWAVAQGTLAAERAITILEMTERLRHNGMEAALHDILSWTLEDGSPAHDDPAVRETFAELWADLQVLRQLLNFMIDDVIRGVDVGGTSGIIKVVYTEVLQKIMAWLTNLEGVRSQPQRPMLEINGWETGYWMRDYVGSFSWHMGGGTSEIMRNVIAERMLGLPR